MTSLVRDDDATFGVALDQASAALDIDPVILEKDYWLTQVLRSTSENHFGQFVLKGGTSLSKGYGLIERFSEDVDLLLIPQAKDSDVDAVERLLGEIEATVSALVGNATRRGKAEEGVATITIVEYASVLGVSSGVEKFVRLDHGVPGAALPSDTCLVRPLLADGLESADQFEDLAEVPISVLAPARTLVEKLCIAATIGARIEDGNVAVRSRDVRHLYDIFCLLDTESPAVEWLEKYGLTEQIFTDCARITERFYGKSPVRPDGGFAHSAIFRAEVLEKCEKSYNKMLDTMLYRSAERPSLEQVAERVQSSESFL